MSQHRISLTDRQIQLVVSALRARAAGVTPGKRAELLFLAERLAEGKPGNPRWILGAPDPQEVAAS